MWVNVGTDVVNVNRFDRLRKMMSPEGNWVVVVERFGVGTVDGGSGQAQPECCVWLAQLGDEASVDTVMARILEALRDGKLYYDPATT